MGATEKETSTEKARKRPIQHHHNVENTNVALDAFYSLCINIVRVRNITALEFSLSPKPIHAWCDRERTSVERQRGSVCAQRASGKSNEGGADFRCLFQALYNTKHHSNTEDSTSESSTVAVVLLPRY